MNRKEAAELLPFIKAFSEGKEIQTSVKGKPWEDLGENIAFYTNDKYRIKPEQEYRPYKDVEECWNEMLKHLPFGWVKSRKTKEYMLISAVSFNFCVINGGNCGYDFSLNSFTFADGTPFGVKIEEN